MKRIYIRRKNEIAGHVFKSRDSIKDDKVAILPFIGFVDKGLITEEEWSTSQQNIVEKFELYVAESYIDGRTKTARNMKHFSWKDLLNMKRGDTFKPMGYHTICNTFGIEIEISSCGSMVRYRIGQSSVSNWIEIHFTKAGRPYFNMNKKATGRSRYYLDEFMRY